MSRQGMASQPPLHEPRRHPSQPTHRHRTTRGDRPTTTPRDRVAVNEDGHQRPPTPLDGTRPGNAPPAVASTTYALLDALIAEWWEGADSRTWVIEHPRHEGSAVGLISTRSGAHGIELGYALAPECWGMGLTTMATQTVSDWALSQAGCFRVWATCDVDNTASQRVLDKAGFDREGTLRRWALHPNISATPRNCTMHARIR